MSDKVQESLSALMDDEADDLELRRVLKTVSRPEEAEALKEKWARYHLIRAALRQESHSRPAVNLLDGIHAIIDEDPLPVRPSVARPRLAGAVRYLGQSAIAASVALGVLLAVQYLEPGQEGAPLLAGAGGLAPVTTTGEYQAGELMRTASFSGGSTLDQDTRERLTEAVYREFERGSLNYEIPVNYVPREN